MRVIESGLEAGALDEAESAMADFRRRYPAASRVKGWANGNEVVYLYDVTYRLAEEYASRPDFEKVLEIYEDEIAGLTIEVPHYSWRFIGLSIPFYLETGSRTREQLRQRTEEYRSRFASMKEEVEHPGRKHLFAGLEGRMEAASRHLDLIGEVAPEFNFTLAFNAESELTLASLRGQVVLVDFWATWCAPCMAAWPSLAALRARWKGQGFEILSITSLQGSVGSEKGLTPDREIELTASFIQDHGVTWPVLFSDRSVNDPEYGAVTLPSYVLINRAGRVDRIFVGELGALGDAAIERLVTEDEQS
ncbi:MAG: TlpA disulfide reductase family protein [Acidobacteria bacterium]|nr:TlpA disulfide reductase family protein [Acidobacteriota bacterium]